MLKLGGKKRRKNDSPNLRIRMQTGWILGGPFPWLIGSGLRSRYLTFQNSEWIKDKKRPLATCSIFFCWPRADLRFFFSLAPIYHPIWDRSRQVLHQFGSICVPKMDWLEYQSLWIFFFFSPYYEIQIHFHKFKYIFTALVNKSLVS